MRGDAIDGVESRAAQERRLQGRLAGLAGAARAGADVDSGFRAACDDGLDNNTDAEIDCADLGCRQLPMCAGTEEYRWDEGVSIPDGGTSPAAAVFEVGAEGRIRKLSVQIRTAHRRPGQLSVVLVSPVGSRIVLRRADPSDHVQPRAFYAAGVIGEAAAGRWTLYITDTEPGSVGTLENARLYVTTG